jgi:uncharacterized protein (DUF1499 family)
MADSIPFAARWTWRLALAGVALFVLGPASAFLGLLPPLRAFMVFGLGGLVGLIALVMAVIAVIRHRDAARATALRGLIVAAVVVTVFLSIALPGRNYPRINDITTDMERAPEFVAVVRLPANQGREMGYQPATYAAEQRRGYPDLGPLKMTLPPDEVFRRVQEAARRRPGWELIREDAAQRVVEGTDTSTIFRFKDDFVIEVRPDGGGSAVHMRSKSRDGRGDIGANAARIRAFLAELGR